MHSTGQDATGLSDKATGEGDLRRKVDFGGDGPSE
jgi:hypothetical protein